MHGRSKADVTFLVVVLSSLTGCASLAPALPMAASATPMPTQPSEPPSAREAVGVSSPAPDTDTSAAREPAKDAAETNASAAIESPSPAGMNAFEAPRSPEAAPAPKSCGEGELVIEIPAAEPSAPPAAVAEREEADSVGPTSLEEVADPLTRPSPRSALPTSDGLVFELNVGP